MVRVIFLDIDGVLNRYGADGTWSEGKPWHNDPEDLKLPVEQDCIDCLNRLVSESGAKVVISSSWRLFNPHDVLAKRLAYYGFQGEVVGQTPDLPNELTWILDNGMKHEDIERGHEIAEYLRRNPAVTEFVILDDCSDMWTLKEAFVHTDPCQGLDEPDVERALYLFPRSRDLVRAVRG